MSPGEAPTAVCFWMLCTWFNELAVAERVARGELITVTKSSKPVRNRPDLPPGTLGEVLAYLDGSGRAVVIAHHYLLPDGSIGGTGYREPKWLRHQGREYEPSHTYEAWCDDCPTWEPRARAFPPEGAAS